MAQLADIITALDRRYPPSSAESWDAVGLVCGDPSDVVERVLFAVDPVNVVADEAIDWGADLVVTHHPLFLRPVHGVAATTHKGRLVHRLIRNGIGLHVAHTNADSAAGGVNDALAGALGLVDTSPLAPHSAEVDKLVVFVPESDADRLLDALSAAGAGSIGDYDRCAWTTSGTGTFRPGVGTNPTIGTHGEIEQVKEARLETVLPRSARRDVLAALREAHPYEEPAYDVYELASTPSGTGLGRIGGLAEEVSLAEFVQTVASVLPKAPAGVRVAGDLKREIRTVAVCGGAGDSMIDAARAAGVDAYVTADLRHHPVSESIEADGPALLDVGHWASEWPWLDHAARRLADDLALEGVTVDTRVSVIPTDPWTMHV